MDKQRLLISVLGCLIDVFAADIPTNWFRLHSWASFDATHHTNIPFSLLLWGCLWSDFPNSSSIHQGWHIQSKCGRVPLSPRWNIGPLEVQFAGCRGMYEAGCWQGTQDASFQIGDWVYVRNVPTGSSLFATSAIPNPVEGYLGHLRCSIEWVRLPTNWTSHIFLQNTPSFMFRFCKSVQGTLINRLPPLSL